MPNPDQVDALIDLDGIADLDDPNIEILQDGTIIVSD